MTPLAVQAVLGAWAETGGGVATLINLSENHTFRIDGPRGRFVLRVHRPGYQTATTIASELAWLAALRRDTALPVPMPLPGLDGALVQQLDWPGAPARHAVLFAFEPGREPDPRDDLAGLFETIGGFAATAHLHAERHVLPAEFSRPRWTAGAILDPDGLWGDWRAAPGVAGDIAATLAALDARLRAELAAYGEGPGRFGLIHADMRLANLLVAADKTTLIDFDDCGFGWFMYDFAAAISFHEAAPEVTTWRQRWLAGYCRIRPLTAADLAILDAMVLLRRMALLAWTGSHHETPLARAQAPHFARVTVALAAPFLRRRS